MAKKKLVRFSENNTFPNLFQPTYQQLITGGFGLQGRWNHDFFGNDAPIVLELGCGKGEYTIGLASRMPEKNFIGMDIKGARMWKGLKTARENEYRNVAFIRSYIEHIGYFFGQGEIEEIWITFPDPMPKKSKARQRLTSPLFLEKYHGILKEENVIHLKTDDTALFEYTLNIITHGAHLLLYHTYDLYNTTLKEPASEIQTFYEKIWLEEGKPICYLRFRLMGIPEVRITKS
ncbi:MAG: tRNA (guanosine(46)-N7)-methyltransferase TrmB [Bacteroidales bacterium]|nr:tRNA (guanosine(46)-N7)-methyltransferase TrmB [Lentimicrobiaceae bacterium]MDD5694511.1 tRNA (guanosine(46)-N7)-methyltransferase TrmB [Bacteroidales bacterium]